jgi:hypothetical protein
MVIGAAQHHAAGESMVPLNPLLSRSFATQNRELEDAIRRDWRWPSPDAAFVLWIAATKNLSAPVQPEPIANPRWDEAPFLGAVGYLVATRIVDDLTENWLSGIARLTQRDPLPADRNSFLFRPVELLGLAVGAAHLDQAHEARQWLHDAIRRGEHLLSVDPWSKVLTGWAGHLLGLDRDQIEPATNDVDVLAIKLLESARDVDLETYLSAAALQTPPTNNLPRVAAVWAALNVALRTILPAASPRGGDAVGLVEQLCRRFPAYVVQLGRRHDGRHTIEVTDEYDVQDALHAALRLHFDDVRDEEPAPSHAATTTRLDLLIRDQRIVIETKMTRRSLTQKKLLEEIAIDKERYRRHPDCGTIIFFVYDPGGYLRNPVALERDASETIGSVNCLVVVAPKPGGAPSVGTSVAATVAGTDS